MATKPVTHYYVTAATDVHPDGRLIKTEKGVHRGMILGQHNGKWHEVSGVKVTEDGKADCAYLTEITEEQAQGYLAPALGQTA